MNDSATHVLLIEDNPRMMPDLVRLRLLEGNPDGLTVKVARKRLSDGPSHG